VQLFSEVTLHSDDNFYLGLTENISEGGLFVATHALRPVGTSLDLELTFSNVPGVHRLRAIVRWVRIYGEHNDAPPGMGLQFTAIPSELAHLIRCFVAQREPIFYDA
jgi:uncharacterized protein (TIGR02266 family)